MQFVIQDALARAQLTPSDLVALGITNQRETTVLWDRATGVPVHNALNWQDMRTDHLVREIGGQRPPLGDKHASVGFPEHPLSRPPKRITVGAVSVQHDDVAKAGSGQCRERVVAIHLERRGTHAEGTRIFVERDRDSVGNGGRYERVDPVRQTHSQFERNGVVSPVVYHPMGLDRADRYEYGVDSLRDDLPSFEPVQFFEQPAVLRRLLGRHPSTHQ